MATTILDLMLLILLQDSLCLSMAINTAFGLLYGAVLRLGVVPTLYAALFRIQLP